MEKKKIHQKQLQNFLQKFLPEAKVIKSPLTELEYVSAIIYDIMYKLNYYVTIQEVFLAFQNLSYSISVVEPRSVGKMSSPYNETNSHSIYIGIEVKSLGKFSRLARSENHGYRDVILKEIARIIT